MRSPAKGLVLGQEIVVAPKGVLCVGRIFKALAQFHGSGAPGLAQQVSPTRTA
jgi:hypothetical protein